MPCGTQTSSSRCPVSNPSNRNTFEAVLARCVAGPSECVIWTGATHRGYGAVGWQNKVVRVHRLVYQHRVGPIPEDHDLDHLCRVKACVNPQHLEPVTRSENRKRAWAHWRETR